MPLAELSEEFTAFYESGERVYVCVFSESF
jgi:hypothetical protein